MKRSKPLLASILSVLVLLLSGASAAQTPFPTPSQRLTDQSNERSQQNQTHRETNAPTAPVEQTKPPVNSKESQTIPTVSEKDSDNNAQCLLARIWFWIAGTSAQGFLTLLVAGATVALAVFTYKLVEVTRDLHRATKASTEAASKTADAAQAQLDFTKAANEQNITIAKESVEAAKGSAQAAQQSVEVGKLALRADRPYVIVEECALMGVPDTGPVPWKPTEAAAVGSPISASITLRNFGKGPAIIVDLVGRLATVVDLPQPKDFTGCQPMVVVRSAPAGNLAGVISAIRPDEEAKSLAPWLNSFVFDTQERCDAVRQEREKLIFYGLIRYCDVFEEPYETAFLWKYTPPATHGLLATTPFLNKGFFGRGPDSHNHRT
jgi:hypothetical protein